MVEETAEKGNASIDAADDFSVPGKKPVLPWVIAGVNVVALLAVGGYFLTKGDAAPVRQAESEETVPAKSRPKATEPVQETVTGAGEIGPLLQLDTFIVNLNEPGANRYLKVGMQLELKTSGAQEVVEKLKPVLRDRTIAYLSSLTYAQTQGLVAKERIRLELLNRFNGVLGRPLIRNVYFTDFLIQ